MKNAFIALIALAGPLFAQAQELSIKLTGVHKLSTYEVKVDASCADDYFLGRHSLKEILEQKNFNDLDINLRNYLMRSLDQAQALRCKITLPAGLINQNAKVSVKNKRALLVDFDSEVPFGVRQVNAIPFVSSDNKEIEVYVYFLSKEPKQAIPRDHIVMPELKNSGALQLVVTVEEKQ